MMRRFSHPIRLEPSVLVTTQLSQGLSGAGEICSDGDDGHVGDSFRIGTIGAKSDVRRGRRR